MRDLPSVRDTARDAVRRARARPPAEPPRIGFRQRLRDRFESREFLRLRELEPDAETIYYVYVTDDDGRLAGVLSLRDLIVAKPSTRIADVMIREPVAVGALSGQEEVAQVVARYNLLAVPVVDAEGRLVGIVTVDDAMDAILPTAWKKRLPRLFARS